MSCTAPLNIVRNLQTEKLCKLKIKRIVYSTMDGFESIKLKDYKPTSISEGDNYYNSLLFI